MSERGRETPERSQALRALDWLRGVHPDARVSSLLIPSDDALVPVRVEISVHDGPAGVGHGVAAAVEEAEDRAIVRAAEVLGYRAELATPDDDEDDPFVHDPEPRPIEMIQTTAPTPRAGRSGQLGPSVVTRPRAQTPPVAVPVPPTELRPASQPSEEPPPFEDEDRELEMEDISWTAFWKWARAEGFDTGEAVARAIGRPIQGLTPRQVRDLLRTNL